MKAIVIHAAVAALLLVARAEAAPIVEVVFVDPARYTDAKLFGDVASELEVTLGELRTHLEARGAKFLNDGDRLVIEVLDLDLAGSAEMWRSRGRDVRVLRDVTVPSMHLRYALTRGGIESTGEERISDLGYLRDRTRCRISERLCHEKHLLDEWFGRRVVGETAQRLQ